MGERTVQLRFMKPDCGADTELFRQGKILEHLTEWRQVTAKALCTKRPQRVGAVVKDGCCGGGDDAMAADFIKNGFEAVDVSQDLRRRGFSPQQPLSLFEDGGFEETVRKVLQAICVAHPLCEMDVGRNARLSDLCHRLSRSSSVGLPSLVCNASLVHLNRSSRSTLCFERQPLTSMEGSTYRILTTLLSTPQ